MNYPSKFTTDDEDKYEGIKEAYPKFKRRAGDLSSWLQLIRPSQVVLFIAIAAFGILTQLTYTGKLYKLLTADNFLQAFFAVSVLALVRISVTIVNQVSDFRIDATNKAYRPIPMDKIDKNTARGAGLLIAFFSLWRSFYVSEIFSLLILLHLSMGIFYSLEPIRVKKRGAWVSLLWLSINRGLLLFPIMWSVFGNILSLLPWILGSVTFFWVFAFQSTKDYTDKTGDQYYGVETLPILYDNTQLYYILSLFGVIPFALLSLYLTNDLLPHAFAYMFLNVVNYAMMTEYLKEPAECEKFENTQSWVIFCFGLGAWYFLSFISVLLFSEYFISSTMPKL